MSSGFHRGGFTDLSVERGRQHVAAFGDEGDVRLLVECHANDDVRRYWDDKTFTRETMHLRLARERVTPRLDDEGDGGLDLFLVPAARGRGLGPDGARAMASHSAPSIQMEFSRR